MLPSTRPIEFRRFRAPRDNRSALVEPPWGEIGPVVAANAQLHAQQTYDFQGWSLEQLSRQARSELLRDAQRWTSTYRDVRPLFTGGAELVFLAGHQPQLFHPGVWFKNFALGALAQRYRAVGINLLIDSDTIKSAAVRVPGGSPQDPAMASIPFDEHGPPVPFEQRPILDRAVLADFGQLAAQRLSALVPDPLLRQYWPMVLQRARQTENLGACLAQARHQLEGQWGVQTLEVPQSRVCQSESFAWFLAHLVAHLPRFREVYNASIRVYRQAHRIRNAAHPVPELAADGPWLEAPFWIWSTKDPLRRPLFVTQRGQEVVLGNRAGLEIALPLSADADPVRAVGRLLDHSCRGVKIRSRALITTLWARLVLGDLFLHGIGGAKYDQVTDLLIRQFFGLQPPGLMVISATLQLPIAEQPERWEDSSEIKQRLRDLQWHPERYVLADDGAPPGDPARLMRRKADLIQTPPARDNGRLRFEEIRRINEALQPWVAELRREWLQRQSEAAHRQHAETLRLSRDYSFCLYPGDMLRDFFRSQLPSDG
jgi:hypothetical protein